MPKDPMFAAYAKTAPLLDLRSYIQHAETKLAEYDLSAQTIGIIGRMVALEQKLVGVVGTPALSKEVWNLIATFKGSIPGWAGNCGIGGGWVEPITSTWDLSTLTQYIPLGGKNGSKRMPFTLPGLVAKHAEAMKRADERNRFQVPLRNTPLTLDDARALIGRTTLPAVVATSTPKPARKAAQKATDAIPCPNRSCSHGTLERVTPLRLTCTACHQTWNLVSTEKAARVAKAPKVEGSKPRRLWLIHARTDSGQDRYVVEPHKAQADATVSRLQADGLTIVEVKARFDFTLAALGIEVAA